MGLLRRIFGVDRDRYQLHALVSSRVLEQAGVERIKTHVVCDLDKTYVETEFESWVKMARIPFERPHEKITVAGASEVLQALRWGAGASNGPLSVAQPDGFPRAGLHFVSSSPPQLRPALEGKLILDNLDWSSDTFKNQTYNLRMGRMDLLRHHIAYKTKAILDVVQRCPQDACLWLIGDNAEYDSFVYVGVHLFLSGRLSVQGLGQWLAAAKVEPVVMDQVLVGADKINTRGIRVQGILIRKLANYPSIDVREFSADIFSFESWLQVAWMLLRTEIILPDALWPLIRSFHNVHGVSLAHAAWALAATKGHTSDFPALRDAVEDVQVRLQAQNIRPKKLYSWSFEPYGIYPRAKNADEQELVQIAKDWYHGIATARAVR